MANIALNTNGTASAKTTYSTYAASNAFDGNSATSWGSTNPPLGNWLQFAFSTGFSFNGIDSARVIQPSGYVMTKFAIEGSHNATDWELLYSSGTVTADSGVVSFAARKYRYWRVICQDDNNFSSGISIASFELYETAAVIAESTAAASTSLATAANGTTTQSGAWQNQTAANAIDNSLGTAWYSTNPMDAAWMRYTFTSTPSQPIGQFRLRQSANTAYLFTAYALDVSDDGTTWTQIYSATVATADSGLISLPATYTNRYWRFRSTAPNTNVGITLSSFELYPGGGGPRSHVIWVHPPKRGAVA